MEDLSDALRGLRELRSLVERLLSRNPLENSSVTSGRMRFIGGLLKLDSGARLEIEGTLEGSGDLTWTGPVKLNGAVQINGTLEITGTASLKSNLTVQSPGKITVGTMVLDPTIASGALAFGNGAQVFTDSSSIQVYKGNGVLQVENSSARIQAASGSFSAEGDGRYVRSLPVTTATSGLWNVVVDANGKLWRKAAT